MRRRVDEVAVTEVRKGGWAARVGVEPGDVLVLIDGQPVAPMRHHAVGQALGKRPVELLFLRRGQMAEGVARAKERSLAEAPEEEEEEEEEEKEKEKKKKMKMMKKKKK